MIKSSALAAALLAAAFSTSALVAEDTTTKSATPPAPPVLPADSTTEGAVTIGGQRIAYQSVAGIITVGATEEQDAQLGPDGKPLPDSDAALVKDPKDAPPTARMFYVAYFKKDAKAENRPITFLYNGGPGSSTVWLHMGSFGPKHVMTGGDTHLPAAPYKRELKKAANGSEKQLRSGKAKKRPAIRRSATKQ